MRAEINRYSQFVGWLKIILPLAAIALFSTLFLFAQGRGGNGSIPFAEVEEIARENRLSSPDFAGVADDGTLFSLSAASARPLPDQPHIVSIDNIVLRVESAASVGVEVTAGIASFDSRERLAMIEGLARVASTDGYMMETRGLRAEVDAGTLESLGPLEIRAPYGEMTAGHLSVRRSETGDGLQMLFNQGVRLVYQPGN